MNGTILLNYNENTRQVEDEEKTRFVRTLLEQMGVPIGDFWAEDGPLTVNNRIKLMTVIILVKYFTY